MRSLIATSLLIAGYIMQQVNTAVNACRDASILTAYDLSPVNPALYNNGTCRLYFEKNGACVSPGSVITAMNKHNAWVAKKALEAQMFALQYVNETAYFMRASDPKKDYEIDGSWFGSLTLTFEDWWTNIKNNATAVFKFAQPWLKSVFTDHMLAVPECMQAWANLTNGAYCLAASSNSFPFRTDLPGAVGDLSFGVERTTIANAIAKCEPLIDTYCQITWGISIKNTTQPFNQTFNWSDGGLSREQCYYIQTNISLNGTAANIQNLQDIYIGLYQSYFMRFVPDNTTQAKYGDYMATHNGETIFTPPASIQKQKSFRFYAVSENGAPIVDIGRNSGQANRTYIAGSSAQIVAALSSILLWALF